MSSRSFVGRVCALVAAWVTLTGVLLREVNAQPLQVQDTPPELRGWIPWVLDTLNTELCPKVGDAPVCVWPGLLQIDLQGTASQVRPSGHFRMTVVVDRATVVDLPGSAQAWPQNLQIDGSPGRVIDRDGVPGVELAPGAHTIEGDYLWNQVPETLALPEKVALVSLRRDGVEIDFPKRDPKLLWLRATAGNTDEPQRLSLEVFRKLKDGVPFRVTTRLSLRVAGKAREVNLGKVNLPAGLPLSIESALPVRLNEDQTLSAQVYAGNHSIELEALFATPPTELVAPPRQEPWPEAEIWVFEPDPALRQVELSGSAAVDPNRTNLPEEWRRLAAYSVGNQGALKVNTVRRGEAESPPNRLSLARDIYLDLNGGASTIRDRFSGQVNRAWRLDLLNGELGRVLINGKPQLITAHPATGQAGVELRDSRIDMIAEWRLGGSFREFPAVGWSQDVHELQTTLHVPPGWQLISASGVDQVSQTWLSSWDLFSLFFVLIVSIAIAQLTHPTWGALALVTMVLTHGQPDAPAVLWAALVVCLALFRALGASALHRFLVFATFVTSVALLVVLGHYAVGEVRAALYPQAVSDHGSAAFFGEAAIAVDSAAPAEKREASSLDQSGYDRFEGGLGIAGKGAGQKPQAAESVQSLQDPQAVVQSGPGVPSWRWNTWSLSWSGPVHRDHVLRLYLLSPLGSALIAFLRISLSGFLAYLLVRFALHQVRKAPRAAKRVAAHVLLPLSFGAAALTQSSDLYAQIPSEELLGELRERVTRQPLCHPNCVSVQRMDVVVTERELVITSEVHLSRDDSTQLPGPLQNWVPARVTVGGSPAAGIVLGDDGFLHLRLPAGRHRVEARGPVSGANLTLSLGKKPRWVSVEAEGWEVDGISEGGNVEGSLGFHRKVQTADKGEEPRQVVLPSWLLVTRTLQLGATWSVLTQVERLGPTGSPVVQRLELLPGEQVTRADLTVERGRVVLSLGRDETHAQFESVLQISPEVSLVAQQGERSSERWVVQCGPIWHCATEGIAPVSHQNNGHWEPRYSPWPGDTLTLKPIRPKPVPGEVLTVDEAHLDLVPGTRLLNATLNSKLRTSNRSTMSVALPAQAEVQQLLLNGQPHVVQRLNDTLQVALDPGEHQLQLVWQEPGGMRLRFESPSVHLGARAVNLKVSVTIPQERWLLFAGGPRWGPAILFWGYLLFILLAAMVLARVPKSPLKEWQWVVLGLGLTQVPAAVAALIIGWFFAFAYLHEWRPDKRWGYNLSQLLMVLATVVFLGCLFGAVYDGLLSSPDMEVRGGDSSDRYLSWYVDRSDGALPQTWTITVSLWVWRAAMLAWSLWLASNLLKWLRWAFGLFTVGGLWKAGPKKPMGAPSFIPPVAPPPGFAGNSVAMPGAQWVVTNTGRPDPGRSPTSVPPVSNPGAVHPVPVTPRRLSELDSEGGPPTLPTGTGGATADTPPAPAGTGPLPSDETTPKGTQERDEDPDKPRQG